MRSRMSCLVMAISSCFIFIGGCSSGESYSQCNYDFKKCDRVAVVGVSGNLDSEVAKNQIADFVGMEFLKKGYSPVERAQVKKVLEEQDFQNTGFTTSEGAAKAGRILNVQGIVIVTIPKFGEEVNMTAKLINVEDGSILWMGSGSGTTGKTFATFLGAAAGAGTGAAIAGNKTSQKVVGGVAGGVVGGVVGNALTPQEETAAQNVIKQMCKSLPSKIKNKS
jgi:hypothetical protein